MNCSLRKVNTEQKVLGDTSQYIEDKEIVEQQELNVQVGGLSTIGSREEQGAPSTPSNLSLLGAQGKADVSHSSAPG